MADRLLLEGGFADWDRARRLVEESRDHLVGQVERRPRWTALS